MTGHGYRVAGWKVGLVIAVPAVFTLLFPLAVVTGDPATIAGWAFGITAAWFYVAGFVAYGVDLDGDVAVFRCLLRDRPTDLAEIYRIGKSMSLFDQDSFVRVRSADADVPLFGRFENWGDFISEVREANPDLDMRSSPWDHQDPAGG